MEQSAAKIDELEPDTLESPLPEDAVVKADVKADTASDDDASSDAEAKSPVSDSKEIDPNAKANGNGNGVDAESAWSAGRLSTIDAESYADEFRPSWGDASWESPDVAEPSAAVAPTSVRAPETKPMTATPAVVSFDDEPAQLVGAKSSTKMLAGVGVAFLVLVGVIVVGFSSSSGEEETRAANPPSVDEEPTMAAASMAAPDPVPEVVADPEPVPEPVPEPEVVMVRVQIATLPADATLELDGVVVPNPYDREVEQDDSEHQVRATAPDHNEAVATIRYDAQTQQTLTLERIPEPEPVMAPVMEAAAVMEPTPSMRTSRRETRESRTTRTMRRTMRATMMSGSGFTSANPY